MELRDRPPGEAKGASGWGDQQVEAIIGHLLRVGVMIAAALTLVGGAVYLARHGGARLDYSIFHGEPSEFRSVGGILSQARTLHGRGLIQLGLLLLIATPIARVAFSVVAFALERDRLYTVVTLIVLALLLYSLFWHGA